MFLLYLWISKAFILFVNIRDSSFLKQNVSFAIIFILDARNWWK